MHAHTHWSCKNHLSFCQVELIYDSLLVLVERRATVKASTIRPCFVLLLTRHTIAHRLPQSAAPTHLGSIWSSHSFTTVSKILDAQAHPTPNPPLPSPASSATCIMDHYSSTPGSMNHPVSCLCVVVWECSLDQCIVFSPRWKKWYFGSQCDINKCESYGDLPLKVFGKYG